MKHISEYSIYSNIHDRDKLHDQWCGQSGKVMSQHILCSISNPPPPSIIYDYTHCPWSGRFSHARFDFKVLAATCLWITEMDLLAHRPGLTVVSCTRGLGYTHMCSCNQSNLFDYHTLIITTITSLLQCYEQIIWTINPHLDLHQK